MMWYNVGNATDVLTTQPALLVSWSSLYVPLRWLWSFVI